MAYGMPHRRRRRRPGPLAPRRARPHRQRVRPHQPAPRPLTSHPAGSGLGRTDTRTRAGPWARNRRCDRDRTRLTERRRPVLGVHPAAAAAGAGLCRARDCRSGRLLPTPSPCLAARRSTFIPALAFPVLTPVDDIALDVLGFGRSFKAAVAELAEVKRGETVLNMGCGTGTLLQALVARQPEARFTWIDPDPQVLAIARRRLQASTRGRGGRGLRPGPAVPRGPQRSSVTHPRRKGGRIGPHYTKRTCGLSPTAPKVAPAAARWSAASACNSSSVARHSPTKVQEQRTLCSP